MIYTAQYKILVIDDEIYLRTIPQEMPGHKLFHCSDTKKVQYHERLKETANSTKTT